MRNKLGVALALFLVLISASVVFAQLPTGTILGTIKDSSGGVVPGATVTITNTETGLTRTATTSDDGAFRLPALPVGHYSVKAEKDGFNTMTETGLTLEVTQELVVNPVLQVGTSTQSVTVTGEAPVVNTTNGSLGGLVNEQKMADLPLNGRNWVDLTLMQPGIEQHTNTGGNSPAAVAGTFFSSNGATIRSNNYMLDGAPMVVIYGGTQASISKSTLGVEGIKEFKVVTNNFGAEYGLTMGSQTALVSKNGTNSFHGSAFEYLRNSVLDAANLFDTPASSGGKRLPEFIRNNFGGSFGGPIRKDKTFFFAVFEGLEQRLGATPIGTAIPANCRAATANPCATLSPTGTVNPVIFPLLSVFPLPTPGLPNNHFTFAFTSPTAEQYGQMRIDHTFSDKDTAFVRYTIDHATLTALPPGASTNPNPLLFDNGYSASQFTTISETHIFSPVLLSTARFSISRLPLENRNVTPGYPPPNGPSSFIPGFPSYGIGSISTGGGISGFSPGLVVHHDQKIYAWSDDIFYTKGRHSLKFGFLMTNWKQRMELQNSLRGSISASSLARFLNGFYTSFSSTTPGANIQRNWTSGTMGFYAQDDIRVTSRLTVNAGLRYEFLYPNYHEVNGLGYALRNLSDTAATPGGAINNPSTRDFSPRVGFAWDVFGNQKTALRGGAAILYDIGNLGAALIQAAGGTPPISTLSTVNNPNTTGTAAPPVPLTIPFTYPAGVIGNSLNLLDYNIKQPYIVMDNLTIEHQFPGGIGLSVGYAGSRGIHIFNRIDANECVPTSTVNGLNNWANAGNKLCPNGRLYPFWNTLTLATTSSSSWYNSLQVVGTKQLSHGLQFQASYTYSKNLDEGSGQQSADNSTASTDPANPRLDRAPAGFDLTHNFRFNAIYRLPKFSSGRFVGTIVNGWWMSGILSWQTGYPFDPTESTNRTLSSSTTSGSRPNVDPTRSASSITSGTSVGCGTAALLTTSTQIVAAGTPLRTTSMWFDPCAFTLQPLGFIGSTQRSFLRAPGLSNLDFSAVKDTPLKFLGESGLLEFRAEMFNIFNHPSLGIPSGGVFAGSTTATPAVEDVLSTAGQITATSTKSRQIQFALRVQF